MFHTILINFDFLTPPPPPPIKEILENTRFGLTYVRTEKKKIFKFFYNSIFFFNSNFFSSNFFTISHNELKHLSAKSQAHRCILQGVLAILKVNF